MPKSASPASGPADDPTGRQGGHAAGSGLERLVIRGFETVPIRVPLAREFWGSYYHMTHRATLVVRLLTDDGVAGEAYVADEDATAREIDRVLHDEIAPRLAGMDAMATEACWDAVYSAATFDILRFKRVGLVALAAVDTAIWDAVGKRLGQPLWRLWGGARDRVPMTAIGGYYGDVLGPIEDEVAWYREAGLAGMKFKVGGASPAEDAERVRRARAAGGEDFVLCIDANQGYTVAGAVDLARRLEGVNIRWFEEPVHWDNDLRGLRDVRYLGGIPVCAGQSELSASGCLELMVGGAIDVCNFDASWSGGPTAWRRAAAAAAALGVEMGHHEEPQVAVHLIASVPRGTYAECFHPDRDPFWWQLVLNRPELSGGFLPLPHAPGLGWELDWDYIDAHRLDR
jgi:D-galactarolactone cycloisomerase